MPHPDNYASILNQDIVSHVVDTTPSNPDVVALSRDNFIHVTKLNQEPNETILGSTSSYQQNT